MKQLWVVMVAVVVGIGILWLMSQSQSLKVTEIVINGHPITVELATTPAQWERGLMGRRSLAANHGMLFIFPDKQIRTFWMKDTYIPLDIIFLSDGKVVDLVTLPAQEAGQTPARYTSQAEANQVLELNAGHAEQLKIQTGTAIALNQLSVASSCTL